MDLKVDKQAQNVELKVDETTTSDKFIDAKTQESVPMVTIQALCEAHGYGYVMQMASTLWKMKDPIGALTVGPCAGLAKVNTQSVPTPTTMRDWVAKEVAHQMVKDENRARESRMVNQLRYDKHGLSGILENDASANAEPVTPSVKDSTQQIAEERTKPEFAKRKDESWSEWNMRKTIATQKKRIAELEAKNAYLAERWGDARKDREALEAENARLKSAMNRADEMLTPYQHESSGKLSFYKDVPTTTSNHSTAGIIQNFFSTWKSKAETLEARVKELETENAALKNSMIRADQMTTPYECVYCFNASLVIKEALEGGKG